MLAFHFLILLRTPFFKKKFWLQESIIFSLLQAFQLDSFAQIGAIYSISSIIAILFSSTFRVCQYGSWNFSTYYIFQKSLFTSSKTLTNMHRFCIDVLGIRATSMAGLIAMGLSLTSIGNIFLPQLLYLDFIILAVAKVVINSTCCVAIANYFEEVFVLCI